MSRVRDFDLVRIGGTGHFAGQTGVVRPVPMPLHGMRYVVNCAVPFDAHLRTSQLAVIGKAAADAPERDDTNFCAECEVLLDLDGYDGLCGTCADVAEAMAGASDA